jgi:UTP:GlnB (protein PII) uridylyltransferase
MEEHAHSAAAFMQSMPERYREAFDAKAIEQHAAIASRRDGRPVCLEVLQRPSENEVVLCIIADDQAGLLSLISASFVAHGLDIVTVKAYTRTNPGTRRAEAVDFVRVKRSSRSNSAFLPNDLDRVRDSLAALVTGSATVESILRKQLPKPARSTPNGATRVEFDQAFDGDLARLTVEAVDRPGLLLTISRALFRAGVRIVDSDATTQAGRVLDRFAVVERDGTPLGPARRRSVQADVLSAIESLARTTPRRASTVPPRPRKSTRPLPAKSQK